MAAWSQSGRPPSSSSASQLSRSASFSLSGSVQLSSKSSSSNREFEKEKIDQHFTDFPTQVQEMGGLEIPLVLSCPSELEPHYHQHCPSGWCHHNRNYTMIKLVSRGINKWSKLTSASCWCAPRSGPQIQEGRPHLYSWGKTNVNRNISLYKLKQHRSLPLLLVTTQWTTTP